MKSYYSLNRLLLFTVVISIFFINSSICHAKSDIVQLLGGDVIKGRIIEQTDTHITLDHEDLGQLTIARERIKSTSTAEPEPEITEQDVKQVEPEEAEKIWYELDIAIEFANMWKIIAALASFVTKTNTKDITAKMNTNINASVAAVILP